jgi:hypothetical protein
MIDDTEDVLTFEELCKLVGVSLGLSAVIWAAMAGVVLWAVSLL